MNYLDERTKRIFCCDFETTVYEGQIDTEVWSVAMVEVIKDNEKVINFGNIHDYMNYIYNVIQDDHLILYFHNLRFDGEFILYELLFNMKKKWIPSSVKFNDMPSDTFTTCIDDMGNWYTLTIKTRAGRKIEFRDSLKLLPFSLRQLGEAFQTKHRKTEMEYIGYRYANCPITEKEQEYINNDVLVMKEALEKMFDMGFDKLTIGSCCLDYFKGLFDKKTYNRLFPRCDKIEIDNSEHDYGSKNVDEYIRKSYTGGWCFTKIEDKHVTEQGATADVNSLYPSMMHSVSGNEYPVGKPRFWHGNYDKAKTMKNSDRYYYFYRVRVKFKVKKNMLPFIHLRRHPYFKSTETVSDSTPEIVKQFKVAPTRDILNGIVIITLTQVDLEMLLKHYDLEVFEILDGCYFKKASGIFDEYINHFMEMKKEGSITGNKVLRTIAKLFLNNLYGRLATSPNSSYKIPVVNFDGTVTYEIHDEEGKKPVYIPCGSAITSYSRRFTISSAQENYDDFYYADTDSIHVRTPNGIEGIKGITISDTELCCWKIESIWSEAVFVRTKTYLEVVDGEYDIKCAGMPSNCKASLSDDIKSGKKSITDFTHGLKIEGKLMPCRIPGGIVLRETTFTLK